MINPFNRYKYHQKILKFLIDKDKLNKQASSNEKHLFKNKFTSKFISEIFKISENKSIEILTELRDDNSIIFIKPNEYKVRDEGYKHLKLNKYNKIHGKYKYDLIIKNIKDFIIIIVGFITIISAFITSKKQDKAFEKELKSMQSQVNHIKLEQTNIKATQDLILKDSLFLK